MRFDDSLLTGMFLGVTMGLHYAGPLVHFTPFFVMLTLVFLVRYIRAH